MVLEYLPNGSLEERLKDGPLPDDETLRLATEIAAGLAHAHARGLVHRDLKPANVLFDTEDRPKIADFGIARMGGSGTLTEAGTVLGTASYISPEQASGRPAGPASDVYSFGVILFRMLTGRLPFVSTNAMELVRMHRDDEAPSVADFRTDAPSRLESLCAVSLAKDPADRPADGGALVRELRGTGGDATVIFTPEALPNAAAATQVLRPTQQPPRRGRRVLWIAPLAVVLVGGGIALALVTTGGDGATPTTSPLTGLSLPTVSTAGSTKPATTAPSTTEQTTTAPTTTAGVTTRPVTTRPVTTATVTPPPTALPTTTVAPPPTTTSAPPTTTAPATTDTTTTPTTTAPAPAATTTP
jgi:serine/threonine-protein kinase